MSQYEATRTRDYSSKIFIICIFISCSYSDKYNYIFMRDSFDRVVGREANSMLKHIAEML